MNALGLVGVLMELMEDESLLRAAPFGLLLDGQLSLIINLMLSRHFQNEVWEWNC